MTIHQATLQDITPLALLFDEYRVFYQYPSDISGSETFLADRLSCSDSVIFVARATDDTLTGFVQLYPLLSSVRMKRLWLLNDLYVHPSFRGQKVSVKLIDRAKQLTRETQAAALLLETAKSNTIGNNLYHRTDFVLDKDHNYYSWNH